MAERGPAKKYTGSGFFTLTTAPQPKLLLAGSGAGVSTAAGSLTVTASGRSRAEGRKYTGAGRYTLATTPVPVLPLGGSPAVGVSTGTGTLTITTGTRIGRKYGLDTQLGRGFFTDASGAMQGEAAGAATVSGELVLGNLALSGTAAGSGQASATLMVTIGFDSTATGVAVVTGDLLISVGTPVALAGTAAGVGGAQGEFTRPVPLAGTSVGLGGATGLLPRPHRELSVTPRPTGTPGSTGAENGLVWGEPVTTNLLPFVGNLYDVESFDSFEIWGSTVDDTSCVIALHNTSGTKPYGIFRFDVVDGLVTNTGTTRGTGVHQSTFDVSVVAMSTGYRRAYRYSRRYIRSEAGILDMAAIFEAGVGLTFYRLQAVCFVGEKLYALIQAYNDTHDFVVLGSHDAGQPWSFQVVDTVEYGNAYEYFAQSDLVTDGSTLVVVANTDDNNNVRKTFVYVISDGSNSKTEVPGMPHSSSSPAATSLYQGVLTLGQGYTDEGIVYVASMNVSASGATDIKLVSGPQPVHNLNLWKTNHLRIPGLVIGNNSGQLDEYSVKSAVKPYSYYDAYYDYYYDYGNSGSAVLAPVGVGRPAAPGDSNDGSRGQLLTVGNQVCNFWLSNPGDIPMVTVWSYDWVAAPAIAAAYTSRRSNFAYGRA